MLDIRCKNINRRTGQLCNNLLAKEEITVGRVQIKCPKCNGFTSVDVDKLDRSRSAR